MLSVIFAVSYQSLHAFTHHLHKETTSSFPKKKKIAFTKTISEKENCPVCDYKFASFLSPNLLTYSFFFPFKESPYSFSIKEATSFFCGSLFSLRGPPTFI